MNTYRIPREGRTPEAYRLYLLTLPWVFVDGAAIIQADDVNETATVDGTIAGFDLAPAQTLPTPQRMLDKDAFIERFTPTEYAGVKALRSTNATVDWLMAVLDAKEGQINLSSPRLAQGLQYIESLPNSPLAAGRAAALVS